MKKLIVFVCLLAALLAGCGNKKGMEKIVWGDIVLSDILPEPPSSRGEVHKNTDSELWLDISGVTENQYNTYIDDCKEKGFTIDSEKDSFSYEAFNEDGYKLKLTCYGDEEFSIEIESPMEMGQLKWPKSDIASLLPIPKSTIGVTKWEAEYGFVIYVGNTPINDFNEYADECAEKGFTVDYRRGDKYYYADNADGYQVSLNYTGNNIMFIRIDEPDEAEETPSATETVVPEITTAPTEKPIQPTTGIRPEFKEAMDSYEAFFDEYIDFMKQYTSSNDPLGMLEDYTDYMTQYADTMSAMDEIDDSELTSEELAYYLEVTARVNQKLLGATS